MSAWALAWIQIKSLLDQQLFYVKNKIQKPTEVLVIVARSRPRHMMNRSSRIYR